MADPCRLDADAVAEPLAGTAPERVAAWLLVEHGGPWGRDVPLDASAMPEPERRALETVLRGSPGLKVVFTRRAGLGPRTTAVSLVRPTAVSSAPALAAGWGAWPRTVAWQVDADVPLPTILEALAAGPDSHEAAAIPGAATDVTSPRWLVCTHGTRDACCARWGRVLLPELERAGETFRESSHLGGHRFAPVVLDLQTGVMLGRLEEGELYDAVMQTRQGRTPRLDRWRGRTTLSRFEQAAERFVRDALGLAREPDVTDVRTASQSGEGPDTTAIVRVETSSGDAVHVQTRWSEPRLVLGSCGDEARTAFRAVIVDDLQRASV